MLKDGPITRFLKRRVPLIDMELWSAFVGIFGMVLFKYLWNNLGFINYMSLLGG